MYNTRFSIIQWLLLVILIGIFVTACAANSNQCEVKYINITSNETNSTYKYNFTYNGSCTNKENLLIELRKCRANEFADHSFPLMVKGEGIYQNCVSKGAWKVTVFHGEGPSSIVDSDCFNCSGMEKNHRIYYDFNFQALEITLKNVHHLVDSWNLTIFKTMWKRNCRICHYRRTRYKDLIEKFQNTKITPQNITKTKITVKHVFDPKAYYCLTLQDISNYPLKGRKYDVWSTDSCKPDPASTENGITLIAEPRTISKSESVKVWMLSVIVISAVMMFVVIFGRILLLKRRKEPHTKNPRVTTSDNVHVLFMYAPDISNSEQLLELKKDLQSTFKVYDLLHNNDYKFLADPSGWIQKMLLPDSGMKLLLVESINMENLIKSLLQGFQENCDNEGPETFSKVEKATNHLIFALRTMIYPSLRGDYSSIFVVRFSEENRNVPDLLVPMRRYKFPDHFSKLTEDMRRTLV